MKSMTDTADVRHHAGSDSEAQERALIAAVAKGDRAAFERLYLRHHAPIARFVARHTSRRDLIDEVVNEAFWIAWRKAAEFRGDSKVGTWIIGIAYRCMLKSLRTSLPVPESPDVDGEEAAGESGLETLESEQRELSDWVRRGLALLPAEQRTTMELAYYLGQSCDEIAAIMNCATGTVKARMFHARLRLRNTLPALGGDIAANTRNPS